MEIRLKRLIIGKLVTDGELYIGRKKVCDTAERTSCMLPAGTYDVVIRKHLELRKFMPHIRARAKEPLGVIRDGNGVYNFKDASILVGEHYLPGICLRTDETFKRLYERIEKQYRRKNFIKLIVS